MIDVIGQLLDYISRRILGDISLYSFVQRYTYIYILLIHSASTMKSNQTRQFLTLILGILSFVGCADSEPAATEPSIDQFIGLMDQGDNQLVEALRELPDSDRVVMIDMLLSHEPRISNLDLCSGLGSGPALNACEDRVGRTRERPHLWGNAAHNDRPVDMNAVSPVLYRLAPGPGQTSVQFGEVESMYSDLTPIPSSCGVTSFDCRIQEARNNLRADSSIHAGQLCMAISDQRWREECFFKLAEGTATFMNERPTALRDGIELCLMSGEFRNYCAEQVFALSIDLAPPLFANQASWAQAIGQLEFVREQWRGRQEYLAADIEQRFWSVLVQRSVSVSGTLCGDAMEWLPEASVPHFRSALAYRYVADSLGGSRIPGHSRADLDRWIEEVRGVFAHRCEGLGELIPEDSSWRSIEDYWPIDEPGDESIPATTYMNGSRRPYDHVNPEVDEIIATVEALARFQHVPDSLIMSIRNHESEILQWSLNRLYNKRIIRPPNTSYDGP